VGQLVIAALGALTITSEYATGMIRTSLAVQPRRGVVIRRQGRGVRGSHADHRAGGVVRVLLRRPGDPVSPPPSATLGQPNVLRAVIGGALFLTACGMLAYGLGAILRHTAAAISAPSGCCSC